MTFVAKDDLKITSASPGKYLELDHDMNDVTLNCHAESASQEHDAHKTLLLDHVPTFEPLKFCLDDSSTEDGDEDMFDDDAFTFGDEDFQALMSHDSMRMRRLSIKSQIPCSHDRPVASTLADAPPIPAHLPLHEQADKIVEAGNASTDSSTATGTSSVSFSARPPALDRCLLLRRSRKKHT